MFPTFSPYMERHGVIAFLDRLSLLSEADARSFIDGIPREWGLSRSHADAIVEFLEGRASYVTDKLSKIVWTDDTLWTMSAER